MIKVFYEHTMIDTFVNIILFPFMQFIKTNSCWTFCPTNSQKAKAIRLTLIGFRSVFTPDFLLKKSRIHLYYAELPAAFHSL